MPITCARASRLKPARRHHAVLAALAVMLASATVTSAASSDWRRVQHPALEGGGAIAFVNDLRAPDEGRPWLAGGFTVNADGARTPTVWSTKDGLAWARTPLPPTPSAERRDGVYLIARRGTTAVAIGDRFDEFVRPAAWFADNGRWAALSNPQDPLFGYEGRIAALTETSTGFLAVGVHAFSLGSSVRVFESSDGRSWQVHSDLPLGGVRFIPFDVAVSADRVVVVGSAPGRFGSGDIWTWSNGSWTRVDRDAAGLDGPGTDVVNAVAYRPGVGFVGGGAATRNGVGQPGIWLSVDGQSWERQPPAALPSRAGAAVIYDISATESDYVAALNTTSGAIVWRSTTGRRWDVLSPPKTASGGRESIKIAATSKVALVALRRDSGSDVFRRGPSGLWSVVDKPPAFPKPKPSPAELRGIAVSGNRIVAIGNDASNGPLVLASRDGRSWTRVPFDDRAARFLSIAANRGTFVIAGWRLLRGRAHVSLWTSKDGRAWRRFGGETVNLSGAFVDVAADGRGFAALAFEASPRGLRTSVWYGDRVSWRGGPILGYGEARAICVGPHGATAMAVRDGQTGKQVVAWQRQGARWSRDPEVVAARGQVNRCEDVGFGTIAVGSDARFQATMWRRDSPGEPWDDETLNVGTVPTMLYDATRDGSSVIVSGTGSGGGQLDLFLWRVRARSGGGMGGADPVFAAPGAQIGLGVVGYRGRVVVVGRTGVSDAALWVGKDPVSPSPGPGPS